MVKHISVCAVSINLAEHFGDKIDKLLDNCAKTSSIYLSTKVFEKVLSYYFQQLREQTWCKLQLIVFCIKISDTHWRNESTLNPTTYLLLWPFSCSVVSFLWWKSYETALQATKHPYFCSCLVTFWLFFPLRDIAEDKLAKNKTNILMWLFRWLQHCRLPLMKITRNNTATNEKYTLK